MSEKLDIDEFHRQNPLVLFSPYTHMQILCLRRLSESILNDLETFITEEIIDGNLMQKTYGDFWLFIVGSFEVTRTLSTKRKSFKQETINKLEDLRSFLARIRMPFAKQEFAGRKIPIYSENSVTRMDTKKKDFFFTIEETHYSVRESIHRFFEVIENIKMEDIIRTLEASYKKRC